MIETKYSSQRECRVPNQAELKLFRVMVDETADKDQTMKSKPFLCLRAVWKKG